MKGTHFLRGLLPLSILIAPLASAGTYPVAELALGYTTEPYTVVVGQCSPAVEARLEHATYRTAVAADAELALSLSSSSATMTFYGDAECGTALGGQLILPAGASTARFHFKDTSAGAPLVKVMDSGRGWLAVQTHTVKVAEPEGPQHVELAVAAQLGEGKGRPGTEVVYDVDVTSQHSEPNVQLALSATGVWLEKQAVAVEGLEAGVPRRIQIVGFVDGEAGSTASLTLVPSDLEGAPLGPDAKVVFEISPLQAHLGCNAVNAGSFGWGLAPLLAFGLRRRRP